MSIEEWSVWRRGVDSTLREYGTDIVLLKERFNVLKDNETARRSRTPQLIFGIIASGVSVAVLILQLLATRTGGP